MKKLALILFIAGVLLGSIILLFTAISENSARNRQKNNLLNKIENKIEKSIDKEFDDYYDENILKIKDKAGKIINNTINVYSNTYNKIKYTPFYFIGCFIIFITVGSSITLLILASANDKKQVK